MNILFLCIGNSARSQIAEGLAKNMLPNTFNIRSAGSNPEENVHGDAISDMADIGIDITNCKPKSIACFLPYKLSGSKSTFILFCLNLFAFFDVMSVE